MNYEKAYKEALEQAKFYYGNCPSESEKKKFEKMFPVLNENEDERIRKELISFVNKYYGEETKKEVLTYLEKQKPAEWSEEDERHLNTIIRAIHGAGNITPIDGELAEKWLKSLPERFNLQLKQEWSEEDEDMRDTIIRDLKRLGGDIVNVKPAYKAEIGWLKSIIPQPHWKPSEEQISALEYFIRSWGESGTMSPQNPTLCAANSLLHDLKSL